MATVMAAMSGVGTALLTAVTTGTGVAVAIPASFRNHSVIVSSPSGVTAGAVQLETSNDPADANTWAVLTVSPTTVTAATDTLVTLTGIINFIRARVSTTISGGTQPSATVTYYGAKSY